MPSLLEYIDRFGRLPVRLTFSLAALMAFYSGSEIRGNALIGHRNGEEYPIIDDMQVLEFFKEHSGRGTGDFVKAFLGQKAFFGQELNEISGLAEVVTAYLSEIRTDGMRAVLCRIS